MNDDRRDSLRLSTSLPCEWKLLDEFATSEIEARSGDSSIKVTGESLSREALCDLFGLPTSTNAQLNLEDVGAAVTDAIRNVTDNYLRLALHTLDHKIDIVAGMLGTSGLPRRQQIVLSAQGMDLEVPVRSLESQLDSTTLPLVACHLVFDDGFHFLTCGRISRMQVLEDDARDQVHLGIAFLPSDVTSERKLTRFLLTHSRANAL